MELTPRDVQDKQFHDSFRGYSREEVDLFLDDVALALERVFRENERLKQKVSELEEEVAQHRATEEMLKRTLVVAQKTAQEAVEEAQATAAATIADARAKAEQTLEAAQRRAREILESAKASERDLRGRIGSLKRLERQYRSRLQAFIDKLHTLADTPIGLDGQGAGEGTSDDAATVPATSETQEARSEPTPALPQPRPSDRPSDPPAAERLEDPASEPKSSRRPGTLQLIGQAARRPLSRTTEAPPSAVPGSPTYPWGAGQS